MLNRSFHVSGLCLYDSQVVSFRLMSSHSSGLTVEIVVDVNVGVVVVVVNASFHPFLVQFLNVAAAAAAAAGTVVYHY